MLSDCDGQRSHFGAAASSMGCRKLVQSHVSELDKLRKQRKCVEILPTEVLEEFRPDSTRDINALFGSNGDSAKYAHQFLAGVFFRGLTIRMKRNGVVGVQKVKFTDVHEDSLGLPPMTSWMVVKTNRVANESGVVDFIPYLSDEEQLPERFLELHKPRSGPVDLVHREIVRHVLTNQVARYGPSKDLYSALSRIELLDIDPEYLESLVEGENKNSIGDASSSFRELYCRRCHCFNCRLHGRHQPLPKLASRHDKPKKSQDRPTCQDCYLDADPDKSKGQVKELSKEEWDMFERLSFLFGDDYCSIAEAMGSLSCRELAWAVSAADQDGSETPRSMKVLNNFSSGFGKKRRALGARPKPPPPNRLHANALKRMKSSRKRSEQDGSMDANDDLDDDDEMIMTHTNPFRPCTCEGSCGASCPCVKRNTFCEKYCGCKPDCAHRYRGCRCKPGLCRTRACSCFRLNRECDMDLCTCILSSGFLQELHAALLETAGGAHGKVNGQVRLEDQLEGEGTTEQKFCQNTPIQTGRKAKQLLGMSDIHGWGVFAARNIAKGHFVAEYRYEVVGSSSSLAHVADARTRLAS
eukprot:scaffold3505_cov385-Prasinococcus_capsulatus_cf.AAC.10